MAHEITVALIGIGSALLGTIVGGVATYYSNKAVKELDWKQSIKREELNEKKKLYSEFLAEANRLVMQSLKGKTNQISEFDDVANYIAQIQLISSESVIK